MMDIVRDVFYNNMIAEELFYKHDSNILCVPAYKGQGGGSVGYNIRSLTTGDTSSLQKQIDDLEERLELAENDSEKTTGSRRDLMAQRVQIRKQKAELEKKIDKITGKGEAEL